MTTDYPPPSRQERRDCINLSRRLPSVALRLAAAALVALVACAPPPSAPPAAPPAGAGAPAAPRTSAAPAAQSGPPAPLSPPVPVKATSYGLTGQAGFYIALDRGYFREEGLEVEPVEIRNTPDQMPPLATGELHIGAAAPDPNVFNAAARGIEVKIIGNYATVRPQDDSAGFVVRKDLLDSGLFTGPKDFKGLTVARPPGGGLQQYYVDYIVAKGGLEPSDLQTTVMGFPEMVPALANRAIDAAFMVEPFTSISAQQGTSQLVVTLGEMVPGLPVFLVLISPVFAREQPEAARRYVTGWLRGQRDYWRAFARDRDEASQAQIIELLAKYLPIKDPALIARTTSGSAVPDGDLNERVLDEMQDYFVRLGTQQQRLDLSRVIDRSYLDYALERLGRVE